MGEMADFALEGLAEEDEAQMRVLGYSNVFGRRTWELSEEEEQRIEEEGSHFRGDL